MMVSTQTILQTESDINYTISERKKDQVEVC